MTNPRLMRARLTAPLVDEAEIETLPVEAIEAELNTLAIDHTAAVGYARLLAERASLGPDGAPPQSDLEDTNAPWRRWSALLWPTGLAVIAASLMVTVIAWPETWRGMIGTSPTEPATGALPTAPAAVVVEIPSLALPEPALAPVPAGSPDLTESVAPGPLPASPVVAPPPLMVAAPSDAPLPIVNDPPPVAAPSVSPVDPVTATVSPAPASVEPAQVPGSKFRLQLAAVQKEDDAWQAWRLFQSDLSDLLAGFEPHIERAETGAGAFYRLQVGSFDDLQTAQARCRAFEQRNATCFVVRR